MKVLITGANGFIGKNLRVILDKMSHIEVLTYTKENSFEELDNLIQNSDFIFHLAGVNRPENISEFYEGNTNLTQSIVDIINKYNDQLGFEARLLIRALLNNNVNEADEKLI